MGKLCIVPCSHRFGKKLETYPHQCNGVVCRDSYQTFYLRHGRHEHHCNNDFSDLRLYSINANDTIENPYVVRIRRKQVSSRDFTLPEFNRSYKDKILYVSFELPPNTGLTNIDLTFGETNFFANVNIEGSDDRKNWFSIVSDQKIFSVENQHENYRYT